MTLAGWLLLSVGLITAGYGWFAGGRSVGKRMMLLGLTSIVVGVTFLLNRNGGALGWAALIVCALYLVGVVVISRRDNVGFKPRTE